MSDRTPFSTKIVAAMFLIFFAAGALLVSLAVTICNSCGYEVDGDVPSCGHCGVKVVRVEPVAPKPVDGSNVLVSAEGALSDSVVEAEVTEAGKQAKEGNPLVAVLFLRNAIALDMIASGKGHEGRGERLLAMIQGYQAEVSTASRPCSECGGSGKASLVMTGLDGKTTEMKRTAKRCDACDGKGTVIRPVSLDDYRQAQARAMSRYVDMQQARRYAPVGNAWVPLDLENRLSVRQVTLLKRTAAAPCGRCLGLGRETCLKCSGSGWVRCTNTKCNKGSVRVEEKGGLVKGSITKTVRCSVCGGDAKVACAGCQGKGQIACADCGGTGERPVCATCDGSGMFPCKKCGGEGKVKGQTCSACAGRKAVLCNACKGDGKRKTE